MGMIEKIAQSLKQKQDSIKIQRFIEKREGYRDLSVYDLETKQGRYEFLKTNFKDIELEQINWVFEKLSEEEIRSIINDIDDMTSEQAYYVQAILKDSNIREKYEEEVREYLSSTYDKHPIEEGDYLLDTIHKYRDIMKLSTLSNFLGGIDNIDDFIKESQDSMYRYGKDKGDLIKRLEEMSEWCHSEENYRAIGNFIIDNYTEYVNLYRPMLPTQIGPEIDINTFFDNIGATIENDYKKTVLRQVLENASYSVSRENLNALACRYAQRCGEKGLKIETVEFIKSLTFEDGENFFLQYKDIIKNNQEAEQILWEMLKDKLSGKSDEDIIKFASENHLPRNLAKDVIIKYIKTPANKLKMTKSYIDYMSGEDIEDVMESCIPNEAIDNADFVEQMEVLIHVKKQQELQYRSKGKVEDVYPEKPVKGSDIEYNE